MERGARWRKSTHDILATGVGYICNGKPPEDLQSDIVVPQMLIPTLACATRCEPPA